MFTNQAQTQRGDRGTGGGPRLRSLAIGCVSAVLFGAALTLLIKNFWVLGVESGGSCGTSLGPCPKGMGWMVTLGFIGIFVFGPMTFIAMAGARAGAWGRWAIVPLMVVGVLPALLIFDVLHGPGLKTVWATPPERPTSVEGLGSWQHGSLVMRARFDGVVAHDVGTGRRAWVYDIPAPQALCAMSRTADGGIGLIGHAAENAPCSNVSAIDLTTGRALWTKALPPDSVSGRSVEDDVLALTGDAIAVQTDDQIMSYTVREGAARWTAKAGERCRFQHVVGGGGQFVTEVSCVETQPRIRAIDAVTGRTRWETAVPIRGTSANISLLSASPVLTRVMEGGQRGVDVLAGFDQNGRITTQIQVDDAERRLYPEETGFDAAPLRRLLIHDGTLIIAGRTTDNDEMVYAYTLTDGRERWATEIPDDVRSMQVVGDRVVVVEDVAFSARIQEISLGGGKRSDLGLVADTGTSVMQVYVSGPHYVLVSERATSPDTHPVMVLKTG